VQPPGWNFGPSGGVVGRVEGRPRDETELVLRAQQGDAGAFEELVRAHWEVLFRVACLVTVDAAEAEDVAQEALVKSWRALARFRVGEPVRPWLLTIVANEARNRRRSAGRRSGLLLRAAREAVSGDAAPSPEATLIAAEERSLLLERLNALPDEARLVLACRYLLGLSEQETAAALGVRPGTVKSRTARALDRLRESYG
jgi:RNA polymerase sigma-70 factor, ECF subfamily